MTKKNTGVRIPKESQLDPNVTNHVWAITKPEVLEDGTIQWYPIIRIGRHVPFGYAQSEEDPDLLIPIPDELILLEKAKVFLKEYSLRQVAAWLSKESGRYISHVGLHKRVAIERSRKQKAQNYNLYARRYKEAASKAEKLNRILGSQSRIGFPEGWTVPRDKEDTDDSSDS